MLYIWFIQIIKWYQQHGYLKTIWWLQNEWKCTWIFLTHQYLGTAWACLEKFLTVKPGYCFYHTPLFFLSIPAKLIIIYKFMSIRIFVFFFFFNSKKLVANTCRLLVHVPAEPSLTLAFPGFLAPLHIFCLGMPFQ